MSGQVAVEGVDSGEFVIRSTSGIQKGKSAVTRKGTATETHTVVTITKLPTGKVSTTSTSTAVSTWFEATFGVC